MFSVPGRSALTAGRGTYEGSLTAPVDVGGAVALAAVDGTAAPVGFSAAVAAGAAEGALLQACSRNCAPPRKANVTRVPSRRKARRLCTGSNAVDLSGTASTVI